MKRLTTTFASTLLAMGFVTFLAGCDRRTDTTGTGAGTGSVAIPTLPSEPTMAPTMTPTPATSP